MIASALQVLGLAAFSLALWLWVPLVGLASAGVCAVLVGVSLERR